MFSPLKFFLIREKKFASVKFFHFTRNCVLGFTWNMLIKIIFLVKYRDYPWKKRWKSKIYLKKLQFQVSNFDWNLCQEYFSFFFSLRSKTNLAKVHENFGELKKSYTLIVCYVWPFCVISYSLSSPIRFARNSNKYIRNFFYCKFTVCFHDSIN